MCTNGLHGGITLDKATAQAAGTGIVAVLLLSIGSGIS